MKNTRVYKERQYLIFDYEDGRNVKYDFATKTAIGIKGKPVKDLKGQLSGFDIDDLLNCCDDPKYAKFLVFVMNKYPNYISNIGTILSKVPMYSKFEQIFSAGFDDIVDSSSFTKSINDIPKSLIKVARDRKVKISDRFCDYWKKNPDAHYMAYQLEFMSLTDEDINSILRKDNYNYDNGQYHYYSYFNKLIDVYGYNPKSLLLYIDTLMTFEAITDIYDLMRELEDYARMMSTISPKFDKYPRNFLTTHRIACRNYNRLKKEFSEELFKKRIDKSYECSFDDYIFIYPDSTQDIKDEAVSQNNCVASYIDKVIDGNCHIMFLRKKNNPEDSLVTIEIRNNKIVQAKRKYNVDVTEEDQVAIDKWNKKFANKEDKVA